MARARRATSNKASSESSNGGTGTLTCPECGKTFTRAASLGAHRNRAHGVSGASNRRSPKRATPRANATASRRAGGATQRARSRVSSSTTGAVNRDALLQALFPNGLPAREAVIRRANAWLDEAEQLAKAK